jgi:hypothetical protein
LQLTPCRGALTAACLAMAACSSPARSDAGPLDAEPCAAGFLGDGGAPDFEFQVVLADGAVATIEDGGVVPLLFPPQGGRVIFAGVRATNIDGCALQLTGALRELATSKVMFDRRTINLTATGDGWGASATSSQSTSGAIASFSNIPTCPNQWSTTDVYGHSYGLEMTIHDRAQRELTKKIQVTPECGQPENLAECLCICKGGYGTESRCGDGGGE